MSAHVILNLLNKLRKKKQRIVNYFIAFLQRDQ